VTALLNVVHAKRRAFDDAIEHRDNSAAAVRKQEASLGDLDARIGSIKRGLVQQRVAAATGSAPETMLSDADLPASQLDAEAGRLVLEQLRQRAAEAAAQVDPAEKAWKKAVCAYAAELEAKARGEVEAALQVLSAACAKGIAAATVSRSHGETMGYVSPRIGTMFGPCGILTDVLFSIPSSDWPRDIDRFGFGGRPINQSVTGHPGVAEQVEQILGEIDEVAP